MPGQQRVRQHARRVPHAAQPRRAFRRRQQPAHRRRVGRVAARDAHGRAALAQQRPLGGALARGTAAEWALLGASGAAVRIARCDAADPAAVRRLLASTAGAAQLRGVWHAAGVLSDALLARQTAATLARVYGPKAHGAWALQRGTAALPLEACTLFSSVAALLGGSGQVGALGSPWHPHGTGCSSGQACDGGKGCR